MSEDKHVNLTCNNDCELKRKKFTFFIKDKKLLEFSEEGIFFNRVDFPNFLADEFAEEFIAILEKTFCIKFLNKFDDKKGYLNDNVTLKISDHPIHKP